MFVEPLMPELPNNLNGTFCVKNNSHAYHIDELNWDILFFSSPFVFCDCIVTKFVIYDVRIKAGTTYKYHLLKRHKVALLAVADTG